MQLAGCQRRKWGRWEVWLSTGRGSLRLRHVSACERNPEVFLHVCVCLTSHLKMEAGLLSRRGNEGQQEFRERKPVYQREKDDANLQKHLQHQ